MAKLQLLAAVRAARPRPAHVRRAAKGGQRDPGSLDEMSGTLLAHVKSNPGQRGEIAEALGTDVGTMRLPMKKLERGRVDTHRGTASRSRVTNYLRRRGRVPRDEHDASDRPDHRGAVAVGLSAIGSIGSARPRARLARCERPQGQKWIASASDRLNPAPPAVGLRYQCWKFQVDPGAIRGAPAGGFVSSSLRAATPV